MEAFLTLKGEIKTSRGKIPMQTHKGELSQLAWLAHRAWMFDVSDYIQDYKESYHNYQGAILSIFLNQKNPKQGVISIGQTDADPDLSGIEHYSELLDCTRLEK